jgi:hypothetical protein
MEHSVTPESRGAIRSNVRLLLRYGYYHYTDENLGGNEDYHAHVVSCTVRYLF